MWDVIVVGTGMGGRTLGYSLARSGRSVLFIEKGRSTLTGAPGTIRSSEPEVAEPLASRSTDLLRRLGPGRRCTDEIQFMSERRAVFLRQVKEVFEPFRTITLRTATSNSVLAHVCGTCRFGTDPKTSVLDPQNRAHEVDNLYVVDASFFPSSTGINPSLTIASNALRVAAHVNQVHFAT